TVRLRNEPLLFQALTVEVRLPSAFKTVAPLIVRSGNALDGLVRSFIGAGGRSVIASHWPAPDDFDATKRLIGGLFATSEGTSVADALAATQIRLMDDKQTSHPYYWAGFAIIGDGGQPLLHNGAATARNGEAAGRAAR
ncbi:MAG TPA: CHAT domain-containing protein, partial [Sphingopyxis sp.]|nr:CHAT domain-containing protein [Sphingopyxis sp.]